MAVKKWTLTDTSKGTYVDDLRISPSDVVGPATGYSVTKRTLRGGLSDGVDAIDVDNGRMRFVVLPTRGMGIWKAWLGDAHIGWHSPVRGPVHPKFVPLTEPSGLGWLDGFDELLVRCGLESNGAWENDDDGHLKYPLHGRIANRPAHEVDVTVDGDSGEISITGVVEESRFHLTKLRLTSTIKTKVDEASLSIHDEVENYSASPAEVQMLYHVNFGDPLLDAGSQFVAPIKTVVPRNARAAEGIGKWSHYEAPQAGFEEQVYFMELLARDGGETLVLLKNAHATRGVSMRFNNKQLPCYTVWKNTTALSDGYVTGLEPGTNFPNPRSFEGEQGRVVQLGPGEKVAFDLRLDFHEGAESLAAVERKIAELQQQAEPQIFNEPQPVWCADA